MRGVAAGGKIVGGVLVQSVAWAADWAINGRTPDAVDGGLAAVGLFGGPIGAIAAGVTGAIKGLVQSHTEEQLISIRKMEPCQMGNRIHACVNYSGWSGQTITAMTLASKGATCWEAPNGLWVYAADSLDGQSRFICDYKPRHAKRVFGPVLPLKPGNRAGTFTWEQR